MPSGVPTQPNSDLGVLGPPGAVMAVHLELVVLKL
jgi:hypothetical protein